MAGDVTPIKRPRKTARKTIGKAVVPVAEVGAREHELHLQGRTWPQIAKELKHPSGHAALMACERYLQRAAMGMTKEERAARLALELERLDALQFSYWRSAMNGEVKDAEFVLKVIATRVKLLGLDQPEQGATGARTIVVTGNSEQYVATLKQLIEGQIVDADVVSED